LELHPKVNFERGKSFAVAPFAEKPQLCFYSKLKGFIAKLAQEKEFYAYNTPFKGEWLRIHLGIRLRVKGIMEPAKGNNLQKPIGI